MRRRQQQTYINLHGSGSERDAVAWYWRVTAFAASWMILGGFLIIAPTFGDSNLRISNTAVSVVGICLFAIGYIWTIVLYFACRSVVFQAEGILLPALASSSLGLLTVLYDLFIHKQPNWKPATILSLVVAAVSTLLYSILLLLTHRRIAAARAREPPSTQNLASNTPYQPESSSSTPSAPFSGAQIPWQSPSFYQNYLANMFPTAQNPRGTPLLTEEELTRQQMLMLLLKADAESSTNGTATSTAGDHSTPRENGTFRIDLNLPDDDDNAGQTPLQPLAHPHATELAARRYTHQLYQQNQQLHQQIAAQRMAGGNAPPQMPQPPQPPPTGLGFLERMNQAQAQVPYQPGRGGVPGVAGGGGSAWELRGRNEERSRGLGGQGPGNMGGPNRAKSKEEREARRREIELGVRRPEGAPV